MENEREYKPGVYRFQADYEEGKPVIYYDGDDWWLPGWECPIEVREDGRGHSIKPSQVGELLWEESGHPTR